MSLVTVTFESDEWQVVPKKATHEMRLAMHWKPAAEGWECALAKAPQPPAVSAEPAKYEFQDAAAIGYLSDLVEALESAFISSWQSTAAWQKQLDAARDHLDTAMQKGGA